MSVDRSDIDKGLELLKEIGWDDGAAKLKETDEQFWEMTVGHLFGNIWPFLTILGSITRYAHTISFNTKTQWT